jgi:hypothetical protein
MAWRYANISSIFENSDSAVRDAIVARAKIQLRMPPPDA